MKKKTKGFTLIELLAIIVILAIIAVITVPIILNVIDNAKKGTAKDSAYGYKDAISKYYVTEMFKENNMTLNGEYNVDSNGVISNENENHEIAFSGKKPTNGYLTYSNNILVKGCLVFDEYEVTFKDGEVENVTVGKCEIPITYKCRRATTLHTEECTQNSTTEYCGGSGYTEAGTKGTTTITYGNLGEKGTLTSGDAFDCDVNGDGEYNSETERFYYVSDLYNTTTKQFDDTYAVMIYYNNTTKGEPDNTLSSAIEYNDKKIDWNGPVTAINNLPTNTQWSNVRLSTETRKIEAATGGDYKKTKLDDEGVWNTFNEFRTFYFPTEFQYKINENTDTLSARLITANEINKGCNKEFEYNGSNIYIPSGYILDDCNYFLENTDYASSTNRTHGYLTEHPGVEDNSNTIKVFGNHRKYGTYNSIYPHIMGVRPVIEVLKTDIEI